MIYGVVLCIGDSLLTGARDEFGMSVPMLLGDALSINDQKWIAVDEAVNGETTGSLLRRFYRTVKAYPEAKDVVLWIGTNDAKDPALPQEQFQRNYAELTKILTVHGKRPFLCTVPQREGFGAPDRIDAILLGKYNEVIRRTRMANPGSTLIDMEQIPEGLRPDGIHLSFEGDTWASIQIASAIIKANS